MSALAQAFLDKGFSVTGSDRSLRGGAKPSAVLEALARQGVVLSPDDGTGVTDETARVVVSTAIEETNPDLAAARAWNVPVQHRAAALAEVLADRQLVAVAGTCGKSTVTAMLGHLLTVCGVDPCVVNGAQIAGWDERGGRVGSVRKGGGPFAVAEVDESDRSLTAFRPYAVVVTNASADHYSKEEMDAVFDAFVAAVPGPVVDGRKPLPEDPELVQIAATCPLPGAHNRQNAELALRMACRLGVPRAALAAAMASFPGVERRLQRVGTWRDATHQVDVFDDYAHNPEKLHAMLVTLQEAYPAGVAAVWRPHGYAPLRKMADALADMFRATLRPQDLLVLPPVYDAGGTADRSVGTEALLARLGDVRGTVLGVADLDEAEKVLRARVPSEGVIVTAGARDPGLPVLARRFIQEKKGVTA